MYRKAKRQFSVPGSFLNRLLSILGPLFAPIIKNNRWKRHPDLWSKKGRQLSHCFADFGTILGTPKPPILYPGRSFFLFFWYAIFKFVFARFFPHFGLLWGSKFSDLGTPLRRNASSFLPKSWHPSPATPPAGKTSFGCGCLALASSIIVFWL